MTVFTFPAIQIDTTGLATEAEQQAQTALLTAIDANSLDIANYTSDTATNTGNIDGKTPNLGQALMAVSVPVTIASDQSAILVSGPLTDTQLRATAVPVSGPLTDTQLRASAVPVSGPLTDTQLRATAVPVSGPLTDAELRAVAVPVSGPLTDTQLRATAVPVSAASLPLPTGAATESTLQSIDAGIPAALGQTTMAASMPVTISSDQSAVPASQSGTWTVQPGNTANTTPWLITQAGKTAVTFATNDYSSTTVTTSAYTELVSSLSANISEVEIFDSSGEFLYLATGGSGSETNKIIITAGGNGRIPLAITSGTRVSIKALSASASTGRIVVNFYG